MLLIIAVLIMLLQNATNVAKTALTENDKLRMEIKNCSTQSLGLEYHFLVTWIRQLVTRTWTWNSPLQGWTTSGLPELPYLGLDFSPTRVLFLVTQTRNRQFGDSDFDSPLLDSTTTLEIIELIMYFCVY